MRKTTVDYEGGMVGAQRRMGYASTLGMVTPFEPDEAAAYLEFMAERKARVKVLRRKLESILVAMSPDAEVNYDAVSDAAEIRAMANVLRQAKVGNKVPYTPEMAKALVDYMARLRDDEDFLYELIREGN